MLLRAFKINKLRDAVLKIVLMKNLLINITKLYYSYPMKDWTPKEIEDFRKEHKLTRKALGELLGGVTVSSVYQWERGLRAPSKITKVLLSRIEEELTKKRKEVRKRGDGHL